MIEKLTAEQEQRCASQVETWLKIGLSTDSPDKAEAEKQIAEIYRNAKMEPPKELIWTNGPSELIQKAKEMGDTNPMANLCFGAHEAGWLSFYDYFINEKLVTGVENILPFIRLAKAGCGWWLPYDGVAILSTLPVEVHIAGKVLHKDGAAAIVYGDGTRVWALHGVRVPQWLAETDEEHLDPRKITEISNAQVRAEFVKKVGIDRLCHSLKAVTVDEKGDYALLSLDIGDGKKRIYLKMKNPSEGCWHVEEVPPGIKTVDAANKWRRGDGFEEEPEIIT